MVEGLRKIKRAVTGRNKELEQSHEVPRGVLINDSVNLSASLESRFSAAQQPDLYSTTEADFSSRAQSI